MKPKTEMDMVIAENKKLTDMILELQEDMKHKVKLLLLIKELLKEIK